MIYLVGIIVGILNGIFAAGAGQILVVYLILINKKDSHIIRGTTIPILSIVSIFTLIGYSKFIEFDYKKVIIIVILSIIAGIIGSKLMKKLESNTLNLISGIVITILSLIRLFMR